MTTMTLDPTTTTTTAADAKPAGLAKRLASGAAVLGLAVVLGGGAWGAYKVVAPAAPRAQANDFTADPPFRVGRVRPIRPAAPVQAVQVSPGQVITVRAPKLLLNATGRADGTWRLNFRGEPPADAQAVEVLRQRDRVLAMKKPPATLKITDAQLSSLAAIPSTPPELTDATAARVVELCKELVKIPVADPKATPLKTELESIIVAAAKGDRQAAMKAYVDRANQVRSILTPEQLQMLTTGTAPRPRPATPAPAAKPTPAPAAAPAPKPAT